MHKYTLSIRFINIPIGNIYIIPPKYHISPPEWHFSPLNFHFIAVKLYSCSPPGTSDETDFHF